MSCLDDEMVLGLVEGRLAATALASVDEHLDSCPTCRDVISQLARVRSPSSVLERGRAVGRYVIGELLGSGAMGRVYSAWQPELDRRVALKVLREDAPGARERLVREAQAMARLDHPNIVGVHEVGTTEDGVFVAMDLVEGETLRGWAERPRAWRDVVRVLIDVARGLAAVHDAGVVHRDVKPDNVIVGGDGRARLGDFGLARTGGGKVASPETNAPLATSIAGTPAYMAPEILRGGAATPASDQFGFGVTAYEVLAGKRPFAGTTWATLSASIERNAVSPVRSIPSWLDAAIRRCLAADPARRFASLAAIAELLGERAQRRRPVWIAGAAAAAVLASGATWIVVRGGSTSTPTMAPSCELGAAEIATVWNAKARDELAQLGPALATIDGWANRWASERDAVCLAGAESIEPVPKLVARDRCLGQQRTELSALLAAARSKTGSYLGMVPGPVTRATRFDDASAQGMGLGDRVTDALAALSPADCRSAAPGTADPLPLDPTRAAAARDVAQGLPAIRAAIAIGDVRPVADASSALVERAKASGHAPTLAEALLVHTDTLRATSRLAEAAIAARDAVAAAERGHDDQTAARAWMARVTIAGDRRDLAAADDFATIAHASIDRAGAPPRLVAQLLRLRALVAYNRGRHEEVRTLLVDARARFAAISGERSIDVAGVESSLGSAARAAGDLDAAERHHRNALEIDRALRGPGHFDIARDLHNLAGVLRLRGELDRAFAMYNEALALEIAARGELAVEAGLTRNSLGLVKMARMDWEGARVELETARSILGNAGHGDLVFTVHNLGLVAAATGKHALALEHYERAATLYAATIGGDAQAPIRLHLDRARSLAARARVAAAREEARRAMDAARVAGIDWIVEDAQKLLDGNPQIFARVGTRATIDAIEPVSGPNRPITQPSRADEGKVPDPPPTKPLRDVGTYGSSQGW